MDPGPERGFPLQTAASEAVTPPGPHRRLPGDLHLSVRLWAKGLSLSCDQRGLMPAPARQAVQGASSLAHWL